MQFQSDYFNAYHNLKLTRDDKGVLVAEFHTNGGPFIMTAQSHTELVEASTGFRRIGRTRRSVNLGLTGVTERLIQDHLFRSEILPRVRTGLWFARVRSSGPAVRA
jgi:hypothetical protein